MKKGYKYLCGRKEISKPIIEGCGQGKKNPLRNKSRKLQIHFIIGKEIKMNNIKCLYLE